MGINDVGKFPFPTPPPPETVEAAVRHLTTIGALDKTSGKITSLGSDLTHYPLLPRYAKMLVLAQAHGVFDYAASLVAVSTVRDPFLRGNLSVEEEEGGAYGIGSICKFL
jgi:ATP-dependent RNA helicase DHX37/DHR1